MIAVVLRKLLLRLVQLMFASRCWPDSKAGDCPYDQQNSFG